jgi:hypothetical protein
MEGPETWLEQHGSALYRFALLRLRDAQKAEEVVQDTLVAALQSYARPRQCRAEAYRDDGRRHDHADTCPSPAKEVAPDAAEG